MVIEHLLSNQVLDLINGMLCAIAITVFIHFENFILVIKAQFITVNILY